jgi:hypothetical protein
MGLWPSSVKGKNYKYKKKKQNKASGKGRNTATPTQKANKKRKLGVVSTTATPGNSPAASPGLGLAELAEAKKLPVDFLAGQGLTDKKVQDSLCVVIPYMNEAGEVAAVRYRHCLEVGQRFSWRKGNKVLLYGLWRLSEVRKAGWVLLVEGESDCWTGWLLRIPALGLPGKTTWRPEWAEHLKGLKVYLWQEPDATELPGKVLRDIPHLKVIQSPPGFKDLNEAHLKGENVSALLNKLKAAAVPAETLRQAERAAKAKELEKAAWPILSARDPLDHVRQAVLSQGYGGDVKQPIIVYLAATSRLLAMRIGAMPVHLLLVAQSTAGKSYLLMVILKLLPGEAYHSIDAGSPRALIYDDADLQHRVLVFGEADSLPAGEDNAGASAVRNLLQDHCLHYDVTDKNSETGQFMVRKIRKPGPTVLITTSTRRLGHQFDTRVFSLPVADTPEKIGAALMAQAELELKGDMGDMVSHNALIAFQGYLQALAPWNVVVPFAKELAAEIKRTATATRILRDFARLVSLIKSVAIIRHRHRQRDDAGRIIAQIDDYSTVFKLVGPMYEATLTGATKELRVTVETVAKMLKKQESVTATTLAVRLGIHPSTASRRVTSAINMRWLINRETRQGLPWALEIGEPLPEPQGLPAPEILTAATVAPLHSPQKTAQHSQPTESVGDIANRCTVAGVTGTLTCPVQKDGQEECIKEVVL